MNALLNDHYLYSCKVSSISFNNPLAVAVMLKVNGKYLHGHVVVLRYKNEKLHTFFENVTILDFRMYTKWRC
jgi:hypothetical protein